MHKPQEGERTNLSGKEYFALRALMGIVSTFATEDRVLKDRLNKIPMGWCDVKMIEAKTDTTIPLSHGGLLLLQLLPHR